MAKGKNPASLYKAPNPKLARDEKGPVRRGSAVTNQKEAMKAARFKAR